MTNNAGNITLAGTFTGYGGGLTNLYATNLVGTIADARLSTNVALLNSNQTFSASNRFVGVAILTNAANSLAGTFTGNAAGLTNLNTTNLLGTIPDGRLSANVALLNTAQVFTGSARFSGVASLTNAANILSGALSGNGGGITNISLMTVKSEGAISWTTNWTGFVLASSPGVGATPQFVTPADVNSDGKMDLVTANLDDGTLTILTNNGSGSFTLASSPAAGSAPHYVTAADVNNDGKVDLISASAAFNILTLLTNTGSGSFAFSASLGTGSGPACVVAADVNGDGKVDLISANSGANTLTVLTNNGSGGFAALGNFTVGNNPDAVAAADVNGDGRVDLISANSGLGSGNTLTVLTNNGVGVFALAATVTVGTDPESVAAVDVNGDGRIDLISANAVASTISVLTNNGAGGFILVSSPAVGINPQWITAADFNADGKMDFAVGNQGFHNDLTVLTNNGAGVLVVAAVPAVGSFPRCATAADVNGDGRPDLISANQSSDSVTVLFNTFSYGANFLGNGAGVTNLNASQLASGTLADARLSANVALLNTNQVFTGSNRFSGVLTLTNAANTFAGAFVGNGSGLSNLNASQLTSGTLPLAQLPFAAVTNNETGITLAGAFSGNGSGLSNLNASQITAGTLPLAQLPTAALTNNATGVTLAGAFSGNGNGLTNLNATQILTGTMVDARLSTNVALLTTNQAFTGSNRFAGVVTLTNAANTLAGTFSGTNTGSFTGNGAGLTNLSASQITSGTLPVSQLPAAVVTNNATGIALTGTFSGNGAALTNLNASQLASGTVPDARLSANVALRNAANTFTATNIFPRVGIATASPAQLLQVGDTTSLGIQGMIRLASRSSVSSDNRIWDIGVPQTGSDVSAGYSFVIDDTQLGTAPEFVVHWGNGYVGIGRTNPATALDVNGTVTATAFAGNAAGLVNQVCSSNFVFSYSTITQAVVVANTFQDITNNTDAQISGWTHAPNTASFTNAQSGLYLVQYEAKVTTSVTASSSVSLRATLNGTEIVGSQSVAGANTANLVAPISKAFLASIGSGGVLRFQLTGTSTNDRLISNVGSGTTRPSFSCTITRLQ